MAEDIIGSVVSQEKILAEVESQRSLLEELAIKRKELQAALEDVKSSGTSLRTGNDTDCWVASSNGSFFLFSREETASIIQPHLDVVEKQLTDVCVQIQKATDED